MSFEYNIHYHGDIIGTEVFDNQSTKKAVEFFITVLDYPKGITAKLVKENTRIKASRHVFAELMY